MEFTEQEIRYLDFCGRTVPCNWGEDKCVNYDICSKSEGDDRHCHQVLIKMKNNLELSNDDIDILDFFIRSENIWKRNKCIPQQSNETCPNRLDCDKRDENQSICELLLKKLGRYELEEYQILEQEIQKIILNDFSNIDWGYDEKISFYDRETPIPAINGRPDVLLKGEKTGTLFVVELKAKMATRGDVGQLQSYVGWYQDNLPANFKSVRGVLLAKEIDEGARYAIRANPNLDVRIFKLHIDVTKRI